jgi:hypothetical protein
MMEINYFRYQVIDELQDELVVVSDKNPMEFIQSIDETREEDLVSFISEDDEKVIAIKKSIIKTIIQL